jgi:rubredoxin
MADDLSDGVAPNCPRDLIPLTLVEGGPPRWRCPECGVVKLVWLPMER